MMKTAREEEDPMPLFPMYKEVEGPLLAEIASRGGATSPRDTDTVGNSAYEALADYFD
jgi:hypothetical protein